MTENDREQGEMTENNGGMMGNEGVRGNNGGGEGVRGNDEGTMRKQRGVRGNDGE